MHMLRRIELSAAAVAVILLVFTSLAIIILRLVGVSAWSVGTVDTLSQYPSHFMLAAALLGGSLALTRGDTLRIEVFNPFLSDTNKMRVARIVSAIAAIFFLVFIALAVRYLSVDYRPIVAFLYLPLMSLIAVKLIWLSIRTA